MSVFFLEGFELFGDGFDFTASTIAKLMQAVPPDYTTGWYSGASYVQVQNAGRIDGNCLEFSRIAADGVWSDKYAANLGFSFLPVQKLVVGFATMFDTLPTQSLPLLTLRYDNGTINGEQLTLWATPSGSLFLASTAYTYDYSILSAPAIITSSQTPSGVFRWTQYTYLELFIDYSGVTPLLSLLVNGQLVIQASANSAYKKMTDNYINSAHFINPSCGHFGGLPFVQRLDDIYMSDASVIGPQHIIGLTNGAIVANTGWSGVPQSVYDGTGPVHATNIADSIKFRLSDISTGIGSISALGIDIVASVPTAGLDAVAFGLANSSGGSPTSKSATVDSGADQRVRLVETTGPSGLTTLNPTNINAMTGYLNSAYIFS
jgi:hypothetical protein